MAERDSFRAPAELAGIRSMALGVGFIGTLLWAVGLYLNPEQGLRSWLLGFVFWAGISIGSIGLLMLQYLTGGAWGVVIRRTLEAGARTLLVVVILFIPLFVGMTQLYEWTHFGPTEHVIEARGWFMTAGGWRLRSVICFALFGVMAYLLTKWSANQDESKSYEEAAGWLGRATAFSGPTLVIFSLVVTLVGVDWVMTLEPHWFSTIFGLLFVIGWALSCLSFCVIVLAFLHDKVPMNHVLGRRHFHDFGKLMLAMVMVWAYFNLSQWLIIWSGNIPEETTWYLTRMRGGWFWIGVAIILFHFAVPFLILLQQDFKRKPKLLASIAIFIILMRFVDMFFLIGPTPRIAAEGGEQGAFIVSWLDFVAPIAIGGIWLWYFFGQLKARPLVPVMDPFYDRAVQHGKGH